ncbi:hypothetical protein CLV62_10544 [Dysgonomonas alginatilytica]|uniref:Polygalacturonase n=1 Tax=Dysgonomonas alginatilytica TaxID=1605892 RepID=A0A2V3PSB5_9BACT|nr:endopygalactorunase [Dysgonomonas alginatilytica]PXV66293.1 hypothetical protein CLV62_10544 [Dysgonomonas alginatilytica]
MRRLIITLSVLINTAFLWGAASKSSTILVERGFAPNVIRIGVDTLVISSSSTYLYTVDTPEDQGLVSTGITVNSLQEQLRRKDNEPFAYTILDKDGKVKMNGYLVSDDILEITISGKKKRFNIKVEEKALSPKLAAHRENYTIDIPSDIVLDFIAGQRTPYATIRIYIPKGINVTLDNTTVDVIGRGEVSLRDLPKQSIGRTGTNYSCKKVGEATVSTHTDGGQIITFSDIDLRPLNGIDLRIRIKNVELARRGNYVFQSDYTTSQPQIYTSAITPMSVATVTATTSITNFRRELPRMFTYNESSELYTDLKFQWSVPKKATKVILMQSLNDGKSWSVAKEVDPLLSSVEFRNIEKDKLYMFRLSVRGGDNEGDSNPVYFYSGKWSARSLGIKGDGIADDTEAVNKAIDYINSLGGGVLSFTKGVYNIRTAHLKSNVWLHIDKDATLKAIQGNDAPENTWFSDKAYRSGLSPTDKSPYSDPENYLTKQDVGHTFFRNTMFFAEREENIKIFGNGRITGDSNLVTGDKVMNNAPEKRADKMFTFKLCKNVEIGGYNIDKDLWYNPSTDEPYYLNDKNEMLDNMLYIDQGGHFVLLATGSDSINVHDTYFGKAEVGNSRDIYDFMGCSHVIAKNIYSKVSSDDIVKLGSDCSLGFTRPAKDYMVRNIIGDTNCNLFQIGSETADDIQDVYIDNIYVLGSNKAGFSISTNDGGHVKNIYLNTGRTGLVHHPSKMFRTRAPFFISISNRGRVIGADVEMYSFSENAETRNELLCTNVNIGSVENIIINNVDISEVYAGSSFKAPRWVAYDGKQNEATPIIAGYKLADSDKVQGGLNFKLPNGEHTAYIKNIQFKDINLLVKGGHPSEDSDASPPEIGVGRYNVGDMKIQPAYGFWFRHAKEVLLKNCVIRYEKPDGRYAVVLDDVIGATIESLAIPEDHVKQPAIKEINAQKITVK